jgi:hypothetical protein
MNIADVHLRRGSFCFFFLATFIVIFSVELSKVASAQTDTGSAPNRIVHTFAAKPMPELLNIAVVDGVLKAQVIDLRKTISDPTTLPNQLKVYVASYGPVDITQTVDARGIQFSRISIGRKVAGGAMETYSLEVGSAADDLSFAYKWELNRHTVTFTVRQVPLGVPRAFGMPGTKMPRMMAARGGNQMAKGPWCYLRVSEVLEPLRGETFGQVNTLADVGTVDFAAVLRHFPAEVEKYFRPILIMFEYECLLCPEDAQLVETFPEAIQPDPATAKRVNALVGELDSDSPEVRENAEQSLKNLGPIACIIMQPLDRSTLSPEQTGRVNSIFSLYTPPTTDEIEARRKDVNFLVSCLDHRSKLVRTTALAALEKATGHHVAFNVDLEVPARTVAVNKLRHQLFPGH